MSLVQSETSGDKLKTFWYKVVIKYINTYFHITLSSYKNKYKLIMFMDTK